MNRIKTINFLLLGIVALGLGIWLGQIYLTRSQPSLEIAGFYLPEPKIIENFQLIRDNGQAFSQNDLRGHWTFIYFGYTYCPDACPLTLTYLNSVQKKLAERHLDDNVDYMLISVDPKRDTPQRLAEYTTYFNPEFYAATGDPQAIEQVARQFGASYDFPDGQEGEDYLVGHSSFVFLTDPDGRLHAVLTPPHTPDVIVADFVKIREHYQGAS